MKYASLLSLLVTLSIVQCDGVAFGQTRCCFNLPQCSCDNSCQQSGDDSCQGCCKIKIKRSMIGCAPPASGLVVSSVPAITVAAPAIPVQFGGNSGLSASDLVSLMQAMSAANNNNAASGNNAAAGSQTCNDPCGDIKQLQNDVAELQQTTRNLMDAINELINRTGVGNK